MPNLNIQFSSTVLDKKWLVPQIAGLLSNFRNCAFLLKAFCNEYVFHFESCHYCIVIPE